MMSSFQSFSRPLNLNGIVLKEEEKDMKMVRSKSVQVREEIEAVEQKKAKLAFHHQTSLSPCRSERKRSSKVTFRPSSEMLKDMAEVQVQIFASTTSAPGAGELTPPNNHGPPSNSHLERFKSRIRLLSSGSFSSSASGCNEHGSPGRNSKIGFSLASSSRILTRARNWRSKGIQAKNERRERRATKTLAIVLGKIDFFFQSRITSLFNVDSNFD